MVFVSAVGEIKPSNVHTRSQQALERLVVVTSRAEGADDPRAPVTGHNVQGS